jgi:nucleoside phosphorylase
MCIQLLPRVTMDSQIERDQAFFQHQRDELQRLWQSLLPPNLRYDDPSFLSQLHDEINILVNELMTHFTGRYTVNSFAYSSADRKFREFYNVLHQVREDIASLKAPIARQQIDDIAEKLMDAQDALVSFVSVNYPHEPDKPKVADDPIYASHEQPWYPLNFPAVVDITSLEGLKYRNSVDIVLMTVTEVELFAVMRLLTPLPDANIIAQVSIENETYYLGMFGKQLAAVTASRMGSTGSGSSTHATDRACRNWLPRAVIMIGIAFGAEPEKQRLADVLIADQVINYEPERVGSRNEYRGEPIPSHPGLINRFNHCFDWLFHRPDNVQSQRIIGPILSGEKLIDDPQFKAKLLQQFPRAIGGEMEGVGLSSSALYNNTPWILVKAICDWADGGKHKRHQPLAAAAATSLVYHILNRPTALDGFAKGTTSTS